jgi:serine/threonine-protein kinase
MASRYRIIGLLGRGGMGEVYRADDLKLGQPVALKFLPRELEQDPGRRNRFLNEVKLARQIGHPNVCRVYDIGESDGQHYLSMEYVDGEDLASLLRRIGRLPRDKASQLARQLCAGLAAAHDQGILHRDLKPANVLIDGRGRAKITDFGLAGLADSIEGDELRAGTPGYMAPEQMTGQEVSVRSDLYSLGLVLYELFTGKRAFRADSVPELLRLQQETTPTSPSSHVDGFDPAVERVILRCLERDAARRPGSALAVSAALPGGDPLAAALAAGETPAPELLAEAGAKGGLSTVAAWSLLSAVVLGTILVFVFAGRTQITRRVPLPEPPQVLASNARKLLQAIGHDGTAVDEVHRFESGNSSLHHVARHDASPDRWDVLSSGRAPVVYFWYRQEPNLIVPSDRGSLFPNFFDPPLHPGDLRMLFDAAGRLHRLRIVPERYRHSDEPSGDPDWSPLFEAADLDPVNLSPVEPRWNPPFHVDTRAAWEGVLPDSGDLSIRVEAGSYRGHPVFFRVAFPWEIPAVDGPNPPSLASRIRGVMIAVFNLGALFGGAIVARRNVRLGRGDRRGALWVASAVFALRFLVWLFAGHHVMAQAEMELLLGSLAKAVFMGFLSYIFYLAVEPYFRRLWPEMLVSWVRFREGTLRDPLVGRDVLLGVLYGIIVVLLYQLYHLVPVWLDQIPPRPDGFLDLWNEVHSLSGTRTVVGLSVLSLGSGLTSVLLGVTFLVVLRILLRRDWLAIAGITAVLCLAFNPGSGNLYVDLGIAAVWTILACVFVTRVGFLVVCVGFFVQRLLLAFPLTFDFTAWYSTGALLALSVTTGLAVYGFYFSLAGRRLVRDDIV